ncbi:MAG: KH domain-containing protein [Bacteroidota bacterium]
MKNFIESIAKQLVDQPEMVVVDETERDGKTVIRVKVAQSDIGKVIGKKGRTAFALRTLASAIGKKNGKKILVELDDSPPD